ncbi:MAG: NTP transferase domain-containing protein [Stellaceae bacterium]
MTVPAIIQARLSSARLPGKVLRPLAGRPMLAWLIERLAAARRLSGLAVATSDARDDDAVARYCDGAGVRCFRGPLDDTAERLARVSEALGAESFVRVSGDSPFMDPAIVDLVVAQFGDGIDLASNVLKRTFPKGMSVEVVRLTALRRAQTMMRPGEAEHVTAVFYRRPEAFHIVGVESGRDWGGVQLAVDTEADFALASRVAAAMERGRSYGLAELVALRAACLAGAA